jgi:hypothetical protein
MGQTLNPLQIIKESVLGYTHLTAANAVPSGPPSNISSNPMTLTGIKFSSAVEPCLQLDGGQGAKCCWVQIGATGTPFHVEHDDQFRLPRVAANIDVQVYLGACMHDLTSVTAWRGSPTPLPSLGPLPEVRKVPLQIGSALGSFITAPVYADMPRSAVAGPLAAPDTLSVYRVVATGSYFDEGIASLLPVSSTAPFEWRPDVESDARVVYGFFFDAPASTSELHAQVTLVEYGVGNPVAPPAFSPADLAPLAWYRADDLALADGANVDPWTDLSGNGFDLSSSGVNPTYHTNVINGHAIVRQTAATFSHGSFAYNAPLTIAFVLKGLTLVAGDIMLTDKTGFQYVTKDNGSIPYWMGISGTNQVNLPAFATAAFQCVQVFNGASSVCRVGGVQVATGDTGAIANTGLQFGAGGAAQPCDFAEVVLINRVLSADEIKALEAYFTNRYKV